MKREFGCSHVWELLGVSCPPGCCVNCHAGQCETRVGIVIDGKEHALCCVTSSRALEGGLNVTSVDYPSTLPPPNE